MLLSSQRSEDQPFGLFKRKEYVCVKRLDLSHHRLLVAPCVFFAFHRTDVPDLIRCANRPRLEIVAERPLVLAVDVDDSVVIEFADKRMQHVSRRAIPTFPYAAFKVMLASFVVVHTAALQLGSPSAHLL